MGQPDLGLKDFFTYTDSVAALANCCLFDNQEVIHADQLQHINTEELVTYGEDDKQMRTLSRLRDVCCTVSYRIKEKGNFLILGIENQKTVDHFMVARLLVMFALNLVQQYKKMTGREILMPGSDAGEFLYKYRKGDKFLPCVTIVLYLGQKPWKAPLSFRELELDVDPRITRFLPDYQMPLLVPMQDLAKIRNINEKNLFCLLNYVGEAYSGGRKAVQELQERNPEAFQGLRCITGHCINLLTGHHFDIPHEQETFDMKTLADQWRTEIHDEGVKAGVKQGVKQGIRTHIRIERGRGLSDQEILSDLERYYHLPHQDAQDYLLKT